MSKLTSLNRGTKISQEEARGLQIEILDRLVDLCHKHDLRYYLSGGTLLGAIRHHGFIPWDDDIDINMPRPDTNRLIELYQAGELEPYEMVYDGNDPYDPAVQWIRLYRKDTIIENFYGGRSRRSFFHPLFIDIFPIDGFPTDETQTSMYCKKLIFVRKMLGVSWHDHIVGKNAREKIAHIVAGVPAKLVGYKRWAKIFQTLVRKYDFDQSEYVGVTSTIHYLQKEKVPKQEYIEAIEKEFEGKLYSVPSSYDLYLSKLYGDYMKIPPVEDRDSGHVFNVYRAINT